MRWALSDRLNQTTVIEAETVYDAVMAHAGPRESDHAATQPDPEHPERWQLYFTRLDFDGLPFKHAASFTVRPEKEQNRSATLTSSARLVSKLGAKAVTCFESPET